MLSPLIYLKIDSCAEDPLIRNRWLVKTTPSDCIAEISFTLLSDPSTGYQFHGFENDSPGQQEQVASVPNLERGAPGHQATHNNSDFQLPAIHLSTRAARPFPISTKSTLTHSVVHLIKCGSQQIFLSKERRLLKRLRSPIPQPKTKTPLAPMTGCHGPSQESPGPIRGA